MSDVLSGAEFKKQMRAGTPKLGLFVNSHSPTVVEQLAHSGYDWLLVDSQHGPMSYETLSTMLAGIASGGAKSMVRVGSYQDRPGIQQSLDTGADGILVPYINTAEEAVAAISCMRYPTAGTRSVYFPQRSMNKAGLLGYAGAANENTIKALQVETDVAGDLPTVESDARALKQVLLNLLSNAAKFTEEGGHIVVRARRAGEGAVRLEVVDSGIGIAEADQARIWEEFRQLDG